MRKIPTLFLRDFDTPGHPVIPEPNPDCAWVHRGEGVPTRKWDGTCMRLDEQGDWWARREVKAGKTPPQGFLFEQADDVTGKQVGWEPVAQSGFAKFHAEALRLSPAPNWIPRTYELCGAKINGNPDGFVGHILIPHGWAPFEQQDQLTRAPRDFDGLERWLRGRDWEGIVFHHPDGRMAKIKKRDFR